MSDSETGDGARTPTKRRSRLRRWLIWTGAVVAVLGLAAGISVYILMRRAEPMIRAALIDTLQKRFHSRVELDGLSIAVTDGFSVQASGLRVWLPPEEVGSVASDAQAEWREQPWIAVGKVRFHASWRMRPGQPIVISVVHVQDARVLLPPKEDRPHMNMTGTSTAATTPPGSSDAAAPKPVTDPVPLFQLPKVELRRVECETAQLVIERKQEQGKPKKEPLIFDLRKIVLTPDGHGGPIAFAVDMVNAKPVGLIHSTGHVGPWVTGDPGALPVDGNYTFSDADLGTIKGIEGTLSSTGHYSGTLRRIETEGETRTPDFRLERVNKNAGILLTTKFHAIVDGTNGDTYLQPVDGMLGQTHIVARGQVIRASDLVAGAKGHDINLNIMMDRGRIEDILNISANTEAPFMVGHLTLQSSFHLPAGKDSIWDRLELNGQFHLSDARFNNEKMQGRIAELSLRGQGKPKEAKSADPNDVLSEASGHFKLDAGKLDLPDLDYTVPGAEIVAHGTYGLEGGTLQFVGDARLQAELSQIVGGWKGLLLKPANRFLRKNGAGTDVPIHVDGTRKEPKFGVDFDRLGKSDPAPAATTQN